MNDRSYVPGVCDTFRGLLLLALISGPFICSGQSNQAVNDTPKPEIKISCNSSLIYPGVSIGTGFNIKAPDRGRRLLYEPIIRNQLVALNLSWYHHPGFHDNVYFTCEWVLRRSWRNCFYSEFSIGPGFSRTFLGGTSYRVNDNGAVSVKRFAGYNYAMFALGGGIGYSLQKKIKIPLSAFTRMNLISMFPYNSTIYFRPVLEIGTRINSNFLSVLKKDRNKN